MTKAESILSIGAKTEIALFYLQVLLSIFKAPVLLKWHRFVFPFGTGKSMSRGKHRSFATTFFETGFYRRKCALLLQSFHHGACQCFTKIPS